MIRTNIAERLACRFAIEKKLFVYDSGNHNGTMDYSLGKLHSGVRATIFGASGNPHPSQATSEDLLQLSWALRAAVS